MHCVECGTNLPETREGAIISWHGVAVDGGLACEKCFPPDKPPKPRLCLYCEHFEVIGRDECLLECFCDKLIFGKMSPLPEGVEILDFDDLRTLMERARKCKDWKEMK